MTWWGWLMLGTYLLCALYALPRIAYVIAWDCYGQPGGVDVVMGYILGLFVCAAWPAIWAGYRWHHHAQGRDYTEMLVAPRPIRRAQEEKRLNERIRQLERELQIR